MKSKAPKAQKGAAAMFDFAVGDWRGKGMTGDAGSDIVMTCLKSPDGGVEIIQFDDDHAGGKVFYAEHLRIVPSPKPGVLDVTRSGFAYQDVGEKLFVMHEVAKREGEGIRISPKKGSKNFLLNDILLTKEGADGLRFAGKTSAGGEPWSFEVHFRRRTPLKR